MAVNDLKILRGAGETRQYKVDNRTATLTIARTIKPGEPVETTPNLAEFAYRGGENSTPQVGTNILLGIAAKESNETATVDGVVDIITLIPGQTVVRGKASTVANVDTASELLPFLNNFILFDASATKYDTATDGVITIDENDTDDPNKNGLILIDGSADADGWLDVIVHINVTQMGSLVGQTID